MASIYGYRRDWFPCFSCACPGAEKISNTTLCAYLWQPHPDRIRSRAFSPSRARSVSAQIHLHLAAGRQRLADRTGPSENLSGGRINGPAPGSVLLPSSRGRRKTSPCTLLPLPLREVGYVGYVGVVKNLLPNQSLKDPSMASVPRIFGKHIQTPSSGPLACFCRKHPVRGSKKPVVSGACRRCMASIYKPVSPALMQANKPCLFNDLFRSMASIYGNLEGGTLSVQGEFI